MMRASELLHSRIVTESGEDLGHVFDIRVARDPRSSSESAGQKWELKGLVVGRRGAIERYGLKKVTAQATSTLPHDMVPWSAVVRFKEGQVTVRDGTKPE
jgi:hypothetical protein